MNYNPHDGEQKTEAKADTCACITCGFRRVLEAKFPDGIDEEGYAEVRRHLAGLVATVSLDDTPEQAAQFDAEVKRARRQILTNIMIERFFGSGVSVIIAH